MINSSMPYAEYRAHPAYAKSDLDRIARSPFHFMASDRSLRKPTAACLLGTAMHAAVLQPDVFESEYSFAEGRRKAGDALKGILLQENYEACLRVRDAVHGHPVVAPFFLSGTAEQSVFWVDLGSMLCCKARPDWVGNGYMVDLKTSSDASPEAFGHTVRRYRYHVQAAYYLDGWAANEGTPVSQFLFVVVEKEAPYALGCYLLSDELLEEGRQLYRRDLETLNRCLCRGQWPSYAEEIITIE